MKVCKAVPREQFNYPLFRMDVNKKCKEERVTLTDLSEKKFFRSRNYLCGGLEAERLPLNIILALCDYFNLSARDYEIRIPVQKLKEEPPKPAVPTICDSIPLTFNLVCGGELFNCEVKVSSDMGVVAASLSRDDEVIKLVTGYYRSDSVTSMLSSISYGIYALAQEVKKNEQEE